MKVRRKNPAAVDGCWQVVETSANYYIGYYSEHPIDPVPAGMMYSLPRDTYEVVYEGPKWRDVTRFVGVANILVGEGGGKLGGRYEEVICHDGQTIAKLTCNGRYRLCGIGTNHLTIEKKEEQMK